MLPSCSRTPDCAAEFGAIRSFAAMSRIPCKFIYHLLDFPHSLDQMRSSNPWLVPRLSNIYPVAPPVGSAGCARRGNSREFRARRFTAAQHQMTTTFEARDLLAGALSASRRQPLIRTRVAAIKPADTLELRDHRWPGSCASASAPRVWPWCRATRPRHRPSLSTAPRASHARRSSGAPLP